MTIDVIYDGRRFFCDVRDQGKRMTCLAHAASAVHESLRTPNVPLSVEYLHYFSSADGSRGAGFESTAQSLEIHGQPVESQCPYLEAEPDDDWRPGVANKVYRRAAEVGGSGIEELMGHLSKGVTPVLGISLSRSFFAPSSPWVIGADSDIRGLHAVAGVGVGRYRGEELVLVRNSWGRSWADEGYAWLSESYLAIHLRKILTLKQEVNNGKVD